MNTLTPKIAVGRAVRGLMAEQGLTQTWLAERAETTRTTLVKKLRGEIALTTDDLQKLAGALGVTMTEIIRRSERIIAEHSAAEQAAS